jgi:hypothetical protein
MFDSSAPIAAKSTRNVFANGSPSFDGHEFKSFAALQPEA